MHIYNLHDNTALFTTMRITSSKIFLTLWDKAWLIPSRCYSLPVDAILKLDKFKQMSAQKRQKNDYQIKVAVKKCLHNGKESHTLIFLIVWQSRSFELNISIRLEGISSSLKEWTDSNYVVRGAVCKNWPPVKSILKTNSEQRLTGATTNCC